MSEISFKKLILLANSVGQKASASVPSAMEELSKPLVILCIAGLVVLAIWSFSTIVSPQRIKLRKCPGRPSKLNPLHLIIIFFLWHGLALGVMELLLFLNFQKEQAAIFGGISSQIFGIVLALIIAAHCFRHGLRRGMGLSMRHWLFDTLRGVTGYLAVLPICIGLVLLLTWLLPEHWQKKHSLLVALEEMTPLYKTIIAFSAVILAPLMEELFFRGLLQSMLRKYIHPWFTIIIASIIFAGVHGEPQNLPALFALGIALGYNYERCGRLWPAILIHMLFNGVMITLHLMK